MTSLPTLKPSLRDFQDAFAEALARDDATDALASVVSQKGFAVYRNTVTKGCVDALQANYPAVTRMVGEGWLRAAAAVFARGNLPQRPSLVDYGAGFADFLDAFPPAADLPYLADIARVDRLWTESHVAADAAPLDAAAIVGLDLDRLGRSVLQPHPSARWLWFDRTPAYSIWHANRDGGPEDALRNIVWRGEGTLLVRPRGLVCSYRISAADSVFLDACGRGEPLERAGLAAVTADPTADLAALLAELLRVGAFARVGIATLIEPRAP